VFKLRDCAKILFSVRLPLISFIKLNGVLNVSKLEVKLIYPIRKFISKLFSKHIFLYRWQLFSKHV